MVSSLEIHSSRALECQRCMVGWVGRSKRDEDEIRRDSVYGGNGQRCSPGNLGFSDYKDLGRSPGIKTKHYAIGAAMAHLGIYLEEPRMPGCLRTRTAPHHD